MPNIKGFEKYDRVWVVDTEYRCPVGELIDQPHCLCAYDILSGEWVTMWVEDGNPCPLPLENSVVLSWSKAEISFWLTMGWDLPSAFIDLMTEYKNQVSGLRKDLLQNCGLLSVAEYYGIPCMQNGHKQIMRNLCIKGGEFSDTEKSAIVQYCAEDVGITCNILHHLLKSKFFDLDEALLRGEYCKAMAKAEARGIPVDVNIVKGLYEHNEELISHLIEKRDKYKCFKQNWGSRKKEEIGIKNGLPVPYSFNADNFEKLIREIGAYDVWPKTPTGKLSSSYEECYDLATQFGILDLFTLRMAIGQLRVSKKKDRKANLYDSLSKDGVVRARAREFKTNTGRNAPGTKEHPFALAACLRSVVAPKKGRALIYADFGGQEFAIAAGLSGDKKMKAAYDCGDPHLGFAIMAGLLPEGTVISDKPQTEEEVRAKEIRATCKCTNLAVQYGMGSTGLSIKLGVTKTEAAKLIERHKRTFRKFWDWNARIVEAAYDRGYIKSLDGWTRQVDEKTSPLSVGNFPMQSGGADMLRRAVIALDKAGLNLVATVHDALLVECGIDELEKVKQQTVKIMEQASRDLLNGYTTRVDVEKVVIFPDCYVDGRGADLWETLTDFINNKEDTNGKN